PPSWLRPESTGSSDPIGSGVVRGDPAVHQVLIGSDEGLPALRLLVDADDVAVEEAALVDDEGVGLQVAEDPTGRGDLDVAGRDHVALVATHDDRVDGPHVGLDDAVLADDQLAADLELAADLALDLDGVGDLQLAL